MVKKISREDLISMCKKGKRFSLVDVLGKDSYEKEHIPGAISIPLDDIEKKADSLLGKDDTIIVYCASFICTASTSAAEKLLEMGYKNVLDYKGGLKDYKEAGLALEGSLHSFEACQSCYACG
ncbi:MAG: sulfurtransferase [Candidatus Omnitrophica bacterium CG11_big_fil_rev_8_21_14_0_20_43_6]|nr:MAG: sulfurtransferase [Candidatus Omnitrophica bacterium CG11_big_fil_rev_8_21_14_0_20_43_6]